MATNVFDAVIAAVDKATAPLRGIMNAMRGLVGAQKAVNAESEKGAVAHHHFFRVLGGHVNLLRKHFGHLHESIGKVGDKLTEFLPMLAGLGAAGSAVGLFEMVEHTSERFAQLNAAAIKIGAIAIPQLQALQTAAALTDVPIEAMQTGLQRLDRAISMAAGGKNKDAAALFKKLGISLKDGHGHMLTVSEALPRLAEAFKHTTDPALRMRMAFTLFGRGGAEMLPMLTAGREELEKFGELSERINFAPDHEQAEGLERFHRGWLTLKMAVQGVTDAIGSALAPILAPLMEKFRDWLALNRAWIAEKVHDKVKLVADWLGKLDFDKIGNDVREFLGAIQSLSNAVGGPMVIAFVAATRAIWLMSVAVRANPILAMITAIAVGAFLLYENWSTVKDFFVLLWDRIKQAFADAWAYIEPIIEKLKAAVEFAKTVGSAVGNAVGQAAAAAGNAMAPPGDNMVGAGDFGGGLTLPPRAPTAAPAAGGSGQQRLQIDIRGLPPGSRVEKQSSGAAMPTDLNVGYSDPMAYGY